MALPVSTTLSSKGPMMLQISGNTSRAGRPKAHGCLFAPTIGNRSSLYSIRYSGPQYSAIGKRELKQMSIAVRKLCARKRGAASGNFAQSMQRMSAPISPPPMMNEAAEASPAGSRGSAGSAGCIAIRKSRTPQRRNGLGRCRNATLCGVDSSAPFRAATGLRNSDGLETRAAGVFLSTNSRSTQSRWPGIASADFARHRECT